MSNFIYQATTFLRGVPVSFGSAHRWISTTNSLFAQPPKKKRRLDPAVLKSRVEKKMKKTEREIARLENEPKQYIPILEYQLSNSEIRDLKSRPGRKLEDLGINESAIKAAQKLWTFYRLEQNYMEQKSIRQVERAQSRALEVLQNLDDDLYRKTVAVDDITLIPYRSSHLRKETGPNPNYTPPDGYIKDFSKDWVM